MSAVSCEGHAQIPRGVPFIQKCAIESGQHTDGELARWLSDALGSERRALSSMMEKRHEAILRDFKDFFKHGTPTIDTVSKQSSEPALYGPCHTEPRPRTSGGPLLIVPGDTPSPSPSIIGAASPQQPRAKSGGTDSKVGDDRNEVALPFGPMSSTEISLLAKGVEQDRKVTRTSSVSFEPADSKELLHSRFEVSVAIVIVVNVLIMSLERQYISFDLGHYAVGYPDLRPSVETWPGAAVFFEASEWAIGLVFAAEVVVMLAILRWRYFISGWQLFDSVIVFFWVISRMDGTVIINPMMLRMAKLMRLARVVRVVRTIEVFSSLDLLIKSVRSSIMVLFWSLLILLLVIVVISLFISQLLEKWIEDKNNDLSERIEVFKQWGSFSRSVETMFEVTLGNWGPPCRLLQNEVSEWWMVVIVGYKCVIGFAVVQVITSVFIQQTFKVVARDEQVMINEKISSTEACLKNLQRLFQVIDKSKDGFLCHEELEACLKDATVKAWFGALDMDVSEASTLFDLIDVGDGLISRWEFVNAIKSLRGPAKTVDMMYLLRATRRIERAISDLQSSM